MEGEMRIYVTKKDIADGQPKNPLFCPIACAANRRFGKWVRVDSSEIRIVERSYKLPPAAKKFVKDFDSLKPVRPFSFTLPVK